MFQIILEAMRLAAHAGGPAAREPRAVRPRPGTLRLPRLG